MSDGAELLFGKIAVKLGYITGEQLEHVIEQQVRSDPPVSLGFLLVKQQLLTQDQIDEILGIQKRSSRTSSLFGKLVVDHDMVSQRQVNECLRDQELLKRKGYDFRLGELLTKKGYLTLDHLDQILTMQNKQRMICPTTLEVHNVDRNVDVEHLCPDCMTPLIARVS